LVVVADETEVSKAAKDFEALGDSLNGMLARISRRRRHMARATYAGRSA
jgi:hypothetical protein